MQKHGINSLPVCPVLPLVRGKLALRPPAEIAEFPPPPAEEGSGVLNDVALRSVWHSLVDWRGRAKGSLWEPLRRDISNISRRPCNNQKYISMTLLNLRFFISDTARKNLTRLEKGINFWARVTAIRPKHRGNWYLAFCNEKLQIKVILMLFLSRVSFYRSVSSIWNSRVYVFFIHAL